MRGQALMESISANLKWFLQPIGADSSKPQRKVLRDGLVGLLRAGRPVVCRMARKLPDRGTEFLSRMDRLAGHLNKADDLEQKVRAAPATADTVLSQDVTTAWRCWSLTNQ